MIRRRDILEDIGTEEGNPWLGHIYNLLGFIHYKLDATEKARDFFNKATRAFQRLKNTDEGPWLVVNYGNLAWLNYLLKDEEQSRGYLSKVDALITKNLDPSDSGRLQVELRLRPLYQVSVLQMDCGAAVSPKQHFYIEEAAVL